MDIGAIMTAAEIGFSITKYLAGVKDSQELILAKIERLSSSDFEAGIRALHQATTSKNEQSNLFREARAALNKALSLERGVRLAHTYIGLAVVNKALGDTDNAELILKELLRQKFPLSVADNYELSTLMLNAMIQPEFQLQYRGLTQHEIMLKELLRQGLPMSVEDLVRSRETRKKELIEVITCLAIQDKVRSHVGQVQMPGLM